MSILAVSVVAFVSAFVGFSFGSLWREQAAYQACRSQQARGDYWHDRYRQEVILREDTSQD